ncbi:hypothetical protein [Haloferula sp. BvORR071]|uniref:hypothetical protein n=1 Tax=Haloferula sp. BvORR071 TaxID=1396141 RepID=UPI000557709A|nr:hypothetical protein [Haloferula sp. BvORR071]
MKIWILILMWVLAPGGCRLFFVAKNGDELKGGGVTFHVPTETSSATSGNDGIEFNGESVKAKTDGKTLSVNEKDYGALNSGDVVDLRTKGKVLVNGAERTPVEP